MSPGAAGRMNPRQMISLKKFFYRTRHIFLYGLLLAVLVFLLKWLQWKFLIVDNSLEIYIGLIAVFFTILGVWVASQLSKPKVQTIVVEKEIYTQKPKDFVIDEAALKKLGLTTREYEVLQCMANGFSNAQIAESLFLSVSTIKTHVSSLFIKLDVKNRVQAIERARQINILA